MADLTKEEFNQSIQLVLQGIEDLKEMFHKMTTIKSCLNGDDLLDNQDLCTLLGITKRTLQRYRQKQLITYYQIDGKSYYLKSDVMNFFRQYKKGNKGPGKGKPIP